MENAFVTLTNTKEYPFNDSAQLILLARERTNADYFVLAEAYPSSGDIGQILISDKACNGFRLSYTGSAKEVRIHLKIMDGENED